MQTRLNKQSGFTLIEVMIVVAIIGILAAFAYPSYREYIDQGKRSEGKAAALSAAQMLERYYTMNNSYTTTLATAGIPTQSCTAGGTACTYNIAVTAGASGIATSYTITLTPISPWSDARCGNLTLDSAGVKGRTGSGATIDQCWK